MGLVACTGIFRVIVLTSAELPPYSTVKPRLGVPRGLFSAGGPPPGAPAPPSPPLLRPGADSPYLGSANSSVRSSAPATEGSARTPSRSSTAARNAMAAHRGPKLPAVRGGP